MHCSNWVRMSRRSTFRGFPIIGKHEGNIVYIDIDKIISLCHGDTLSIPLIMH